MASITVKTHKGNIKISPRWNGQNLAVHASIITRDDGLFGVATKKDSVYWRWTITHKPTGFIAARFKECDLRVALLIAKMYDSLFNHNSSDAVHSDTEFVTEWKHIVNKYHGCIG